MLIDDTSDRIDNDDDGQYMYRSLVGLRTLRLLSFVIVDYHQQTTIDLHVNKLNKIKVRQGQTDCPRTLQDRGRFMRRPESRDTVHAIPSRTSRGEA